MLAYLKERYRDLSSTDSLPNGHNGQGLFRLQPEARNSTPCPTRKPHESTSKRCMEKMASRVSVSKKKKISTDAFITHIFLELCEYSHILSKKSTSGTVQAQGHFLWVPGINTKRQQNNLLYFAPYSVFLLISGSLPLLDCGSVRVVVSKLFSTGGTNDCKSVLQSIW